MSFNLSSHLVQGSVWYDGPSMRKINSLWPSDALGGIIELGAWPIVWGVGGIGVGWWKVGGSPSYFRGQRRICLISLKFHNTFLGVGGTRLHLLVLVLGVGDTRIHRWGGKHSPPMYLLFCVIYWPTWYLTLHLFHFTTVLPELRLVEIQLRWNPENRYVRWKFLVSTDDFSSV